VQVIGMAAEPRFEALPAGRGPVEADLVDDHARMFKTVGTACPISAA
jgi:hypothetical protein